jgi:hypothetical protein
MKGGFSWYIGPGPGEPRRACESVKGPIALTINDFLGDFFLFVLGIFNYF